MLVTGPCLAANDGEKSDSDATISRNGSENLAMLKPLVSLVALGLVIGGSAFAEGGQPALEKGGLASLELAAKIFRVAPLPPEAADAVSGWFYVFDAPGVYLTEESLKLNLQSNAEKFCAGGRWSLLRQRLETHHLELAFACHDPQAAKMRDAAIAQGIPAVTLR